MEDQLYKFKIHPHHLLCILGYRGLGYNENFTSNMTKIVKDLRSNPNTIINVSPEADDICIACPYNSKGICIKKPNSEEIVHNIDSEYLKLFQIPLKTPISIKFSYICECGAIYCDNCARALINLENVCWVCEIPIDPVKPVKRYTDDGEENIQRLQKGNKKK